MFTSVSESSGSNSSGTSSSGSNDSSSSSAGSEGTVSSKDGVVVTTDGDVTTNKEDTDLTGHLTESVTGAEDLTGRYAIEIPGQFPLRLRCLAGKYRRLPPTQSTHPLENPPSLLTYPYHPQTLLSTLKHHFSHHTFTSFYLTVNRSTVCC